MNILDKFEYFLSSAHKVIVDEKVSGVERSRNGHLKIINFKNYSERLCAQLFGRPLAARGGQSDAADWDVSPSEHIERVYYSASSKS